MGGRNDGKGGGGSQSRRSVSKPKLMREVGAKGTTGEKDDFSEKNQISSKASVSSKEDDDRGKSGHALRGNPETCS